MKYTEKEVRHYLCMCYFKLDSNGLDPKECYYLYDTYGRSVVKEVTCKDPITVQRAIWGKSLVNLTIKMWSEDIKDELLVKSEIQDVLDASPKWVEKSLHNSLK